MKAFINESIKQIGTPNRMLKWKESNGITKNRGSPTIVMVDSSVLEIQRWEPGVEYLLKHSFPYNRCSFLTKGMYSYKWISGKSKNISKYK